LETDMDSKVTRTSTDRFAAFKTWLRSDIAVTVPGWAVLAGGAAVAALLLVALD
jgi:hypothetical protein